MNFRTLLLFTFFAMRLENLHTATLEEANKMLQEGNSQAAAAAYEEFITQGKKSSELYASLGRAYEQQGKIAAAALNYQRALMLNPRQTKVRQALAIMYERSGIPTMPSQWTQKVNEKISSFYLLIIGEIFFWSSAFFVVFWIFRNSCKKLSFIASTFFLLLGATLLGIGWFSDPRVANAQLAVITAEQGESALRQPIVTSSLVAFLPAGSAVIILSEREDWDYCRLSNGENAWITSSSLSVVNPEHIPDRS